jgi:hypothetical protein
VSPREVPRLYAELAVVIEFKALLSNAICIKCNDFEGPVDSSGRCYS